MRKPNESLNDFVDQAEEIEAEPPRAVTVRPTGEVEVLKPLAILDFRAKREAIAGSGAPLGISWFHRSVVAGGAFAVGAIILASAVFIGIYEGPVNEFTEVAGVPEASEVAGVSEVPGVSKVAEGSEGAGASEVPGSEIRTPESEIRNPMDEQSPVRTRAISRFKPHRNPLRPRYVVSNFTPTTLVIFIEKGEIKTRIEPQLTSYKKAVTFSN